MTTIRQFWALLKFNAFANPTIWTIAFVLTVPFLITGNASLPVSLSSSLMNQNLFLVGFIGVMIMEPTAMAFSRTRATTTNSPTEFLLTCAIDRQVLYRVKAVMLYGVVCLSPLILLAYSLKNPELKVHAYNNFMQQDYLHAFPSSHLELLSTHFQAVSIPRGKVLIADWQLAVGITDALAVQLLLLLFARLKYRAILFYLVFFGFAFLPFFALGSGTELGMEHLFYWFTAHQILFWCLALPVAFLSQVWCERRFSRLEH